MKKNQKNFLKLILVLVILMPITFFAFKAFDNHKINQEIKEIEERIANDTISSIFINNLETEEAKEFGKEAFKEYEEMIEDFPEPEILVLNEYEVSEEVIKTIDETLTYTDWVITTGNTEKDFQLEIKAKDTDSVFVTKAVVQKKSDEVKINEDGIYLKNISLDKAQNKVYVFAENKYKRTKISLKIIREETEEEKEQRIAEGGEEYVSDSEWKSTPAGQLCEKHPNWTKIECENIINEKYWIGMHYDMLFEMLDEPDSANPSNYGFGQQWQWCWWDVNPSCYYDNDNDKYIDSYN